MHRMGFEPMRLAPRDLKPLSLTNSDICAIVQPPPATYDLRFLPLNRISGQKTRMIEIALFMGLGILGYVLSQQARSEKTNPKELFTSPRALSEHNDNVMITSETKGHSNMVPFFGAKLTQNTYSGANEGILDSHTGSGKNYFQKREEKSFWDIAPGITNSPFGSANESEFMQSRMVSSLRMNNTFPIDQVNVGPGIDDGYTNLPSGGYTQDRARDLTMPKTTDEIRTANKPKLTYSEDPVPGAFSITHPGLQAPVAKNRPDTFGLMTNPDGTFKYANTAVGVQVAPASFPEQLVKEQQRETTSREYYGDGQAAQGGFLSYIREFTEPFEEFMKLTVGEHFGTGGGAGALSQGTYVVDQYLAAYTNQNREDLTNTDWKSPGLSINGLHAGPQSYNVQMKKTTEPLLEEAARLNHSSNITPTAAHTLHQGSMHYTEPRQQDIEMVRNEPGILTAFLNNPYTQSLSSVA